MGGKQSKPSSNPPPLIDPIYLPQKSSSSASSSSISRASASRYDSITDDWSWVYGIRETSLLDWRMDLSDDEIMQRYQMQRDLPVEIMDCLYLGSAKSVQNIPLLQSLGITAVLNVAGSVALKSDNFGKLLETHGIIYKQIDAKDELSYPLLDTHWKEAYEFIQSTTTDDKRGKVVVHCVAGINRSALIAAASYMNETQSSVLQTVKHVRMQRGNMALSNEGFQQQLVAMARLQNLLGKKPGDLGCVIEEEAPPTPRLVNGLFSFP